MINAGSDYAMLKPLRNMQFLPFLLNFLHPWKVITYDDESHGADVNIGKGGWRVLHISLLVYVCGAIAYLNNCVG